MSSLGRWELYFDLLSAPVSVGGFIVKTDAVNDAGEVELRALVSWGPAFSVRLFVYI